MEQASAEYGVGGSDTNFLRFEKSGEYKMRIMTPGFPLGSYFFGKGMKPRIAYSDMPNKPKDPETGENMKPAVKFVCYAIDRDDGKLKIAELPWTVVKAISAYQEDDEHAFDDFPMPYDIKVTFDKEAAPADKYKIMASRHNTEITEEEQAAFDEQMAKMTPEQYVEKRKDKQRQEDAATASYEQLGNEQKNANDYPEEQINPEDIPS